MLNITTGVEKTPIKIVIYGAEGVGKSSLAAKFPNALFLDTEGGTSRLDVRRIKITSWEELLATVKEIIASPDVCKSLVIDTADWAESFCIDYICNKYRQASIETCYRIKDVEKVPPQALKEAGKDAAEGAAQDAAAPLLTPGA